MSELVHILHDELKNQGNDDKKHHSLSLLESKLKFANETVFETDFEFKKKEEIASMSNEDFRKALKDLDDYYKHSAEKMIKNKSKEKKIPQKTKNRIHVLDKLNFVKKQAVRSGIDEGYRIKSAKEVARMTAEELELEFEMMEEFYEQKRARLIEENKLREEKYEKRLKEKRENEKKEAIERKEKNDLEAQLLKKEAFLTKKRESIEYKIELARHNLHSFFPGIYAHSSLGARILELQIALDSLPTSFL